MKLCISCRSLSVDRQCTVHNNPPKKMRLYVFLHSPLFSLPLVLCICLDVYVCVYIGSKKVRGRGGEWLFCFLQPFSSWQSFTVRFRFVRFSRQDNAKQLVEHQCTQHQIWCQNLFDSSREDIIISVFFLLVAIYHKMYTTYHARYRVSYILPQIVSFFIRQNM